MQAVIQKKSILGSMVESVCDADTANFWLQKFNPLWSVNQSLGCIVEKYQTAVDTVSLKIQINKKFNMGLAGQHHPVIVETNGRRYERTYSLTQIDPTHVLLTAKKVHTGVVSTWLCEKAQVGDLLEFGLPYGDMLTHKDHAPMLLLAAGSGITPMYSLIMAMVQSKQIETKPITLMYWVKKKEDAAFKTELEQWAVQYSSFKLQIFYTQEVEADERLSAAHVDTVPHLQDTTVYSCGPSGFVSTAEQLFATAKMMKSEAFSLTPILNHDTGFIQVTLSQSNQVVTIPKGQSILAGLEQQKIQPKFGCRMGVCNKCACHKVQGSTQNLVNGIENTEPGNLLKICVNSAQTDLVIDL